VGADNDGGAPRSDGTTPSCSDSCANKCSFTAEMVRIRCLLWLSGGLCKRSGSCGGPSLWISRHPGTTSPRSRLAIKLASISRKKACFCWRCSFLRSFSMTRISRGCATIVCCVRKNKQKTERKGARDKEKIRVRGQQYKDARQAQQQHRSK